MGLTSSGQEQHFSSLDSCFQVIASFIDALQRNFKEDTHYAYPLLPTQANIIYVLDEEVAGKMKSYISSLMKDACGFAETEFSIIQKPPAEAGGLHKLRLEFSRGMDFELIHTLQEKTAGLDERIEQINASR